MRKQKKKKRYVSVPVIMQLETSECGAACLAMVLAFYKKWLPLEEVRRGCGVSRDGSNARNIMLAAQNYGLEAKAYRFELQDIKESVNFPCIVHWNFNHFVVLNGFKKNAAVINDPARGTVTVDMQEFEESMNGIYSSSVCTSTIDEAPMVYKPMVEIMENIKDTVDIVDVIRPVYNFKAH